MNKMNDQEQINAEFELLLNSLREDTNEKSKQLVKEAFEFADKAHRGVRRRSGEPYILHPIAVAQIAVKELGLGKTSAIAALLHDVVEDTDYTVEDIANLFGRKVAVIVDGLTKISGVMDKDTSKQAESFRKMIFTLSEDVRVILIKIADRLHNMRTLESMPEYKQVKIASETLFIYAPLAHRVGLHAVKTELEDLSMRYEHPQEYNSLSNEITSYQKQMIDVFKEFSKPIKAKLDASGYKYELKARTKSVYSTWRKMQKRGIQVGEIYDLLAVRIVFEPKEEESEVSNCWDIFSHIAKLYTLNTKRTRDWLSVPKANGYEALHLTVMGLGGRWFEVQIRSKRMNELAEKGLAAHWIYKGSSEYTELDKWLSNVKEVLKQPDTTALEFLNDFKLNLFVNEIRVFTPDGDMLTLPQGATALDLAYEIHSQIGNNCIGAKVNHRLVAMSHKLKGGDQIEILTSHNQHPEKEWLKLVVTSKARTGIEQALKRERREKINVGKEIYKSVLERLAMSDTDEVLNKVLDVYNLHNSHDLFIELANGVISQEEVEKLLHKKAENMFIKYWKLQFGSKDIKQTKTSEDKSNVVDIRKTDLVTATCCNPIPGDDIVVFKFSETDFKIHKRSCTEAIRLMASFGDKIVPIKWISHTRMSFLAEIKLNGIDRNGLVGEITNLVSKEAKIKMRVIHFEAHDGIFEGTIQLYVYHVSDLNKLIASIGRIDGVQNVARVELESNK